MALSNSGSKQPNSKFLSANARVEGKSRTYLLNLTKDPGNQIVTPLTDTKSFQEHCQAEVSGLTVRESCGTRFSVSARVVDYYVL